MPETFGPLRKRKVSGTFLGHVMDAFIAATAEFHELTLLTRNVADFEVFGLPLVSPWTSTGG